MALAQQLDDFASHFQGPQAKHPYTTVKSTMDDWAAQFDPSTTPQVGDRLPDFNLQDSFGTSIDRASLFGSTAPSSAPDSAQRAQRPEASLSLITFFRGAWCVFCSFQLQEMARRADEFEALGVRVVFVSPELPPYAHSTEEKFFADTKFLVLTDEDNKLARQIGLVWKQPDEMREVLDGFGYEVPKRNGNDKYEVPVPASFLIDAEGVVRKAYANADFMKRLEPDTALEWVQEVQRGER